MPELMNEMNGNPRALNGAGGYTNGAANSAAPPVDVPAEQSLLGAMLIEAAAIETAQGLVSCADFTRPGHQVLFDTLTTMHRAGLPADFVTVQAELRTRAALEAVGGVTYLMALFEATPTAANVAHYAGIVSDKARQRRTLAVVDRARAALLAGVTDTGAFLAALSADVARASEGAAGGASGDVKPFAERLLDLADVPPPGEVPRLFGDYFLRGAAHWLTGETGVGKSTFVYNLACALAEGTPLWGEECEPTGVLYVDLESGEWTRSAKVERLYQGTDRVRGRLLFLRDALRVPAETPALMEAVKRHDIGLLIFDTARRVFSVRDENDNAEGYYKVTPLLDALKARGVSSLTLGHPSKNGNGSARGAGAQEDAGDVNLSLTMFSGEKSDPHGVVKLAVTKNRLLGYPSPLMLRRLGGDRFERIGQSDAEAMPATEEVSTVASRCTETIVEVVGASSRAMRHGEILKKLMEAGYTEGTARKSISQAQKAGRIEHDLEGGYILR